MTRAIMIGDSQTDERAARNAGLPFIYVTFGYGPDPEDLSAYPAAATYREVSAAIGTIVD